MVSWLEAHSEEKLVNLKTFIQTIQREKVGTWELPNGVVFYPNYTQREKFRLDGKELKNVFFIQTTQREQLELKNDL